MAYHSRNSLGYFSPGVFFSDAWFVFFPGSETSVEFEGVTLFSSEMSISLLVKWFLFKWFLFVWPPGTWGGVPQASPSASVGDPPLRSLADVSTPCFLS